MVTRLTTSLLLLWLGLVSVQAAELTAKVDRKEVGQNEHVVLTLSLINSDTRLRAQGVSPNVDLSVLTKDFDVGTPHVANNYNIFRGRGRSTSTLRVDLFPRRAGRLMIPAFTVDGLSTQPITVQARGLPPGEMPEVFSRAGVNKETVWQREQLVAWLDVYHRVQLKSASIGEYIATEPLAIELMEHRDLPQSERKETVKGIDYDVTRIAWAIFPKQHGTLTLYLPDAWLVTADGRKLRLPHQQKQVEVKALPTAVTADIPVGKPELSQTPPQPAPSVNALSTWTVTVRGPFSRFALPDTLPLPPLPTGIKLYSDHAQRDEETATAGLTMALHYTLSALPQQGGDFSLPPLRIPYFDPARGVIDLVELPGPRLEVPTTPPMTATADTPPASKTAKPASGWQIATLVFAALWILSLLLLWRRPRPPTAATKPVAPQRAPPPPPNHHPLQARLLTAFGSRTLEQGLRDWEARHGGAQSVRDAVHAVQRLCYGQEENLDGAELERAVEEAVATIRAAAPQTIEAANDPWRPEAFAVKPPHQ